MLYLKIFLLVFVNFLFLPIYAVSFVLVIISVFLPIFPSKIGIKNLKERLKLTTLKAYFYLFCLYMNYVFYFIEAFFLDKLHLTHTYGESPQSRQIEIEKMLNYYPKNSGGIVYLLPHMANVEMYAATTIQAHKRIGKGYLYALAQPSRIACVNKFLSWYRLRPGMGIIWTGKTVFQEMQQRISEGASICLLADQKPKKGGLFLKFFGNFASFPVSGIKLCMDKKMIVNYASSRRIFPGLLRLKFCLGNNSHLKVDQKFPHPDNKTQALKQADVWYETIDRHSLVVQEMACFCHWLENEIRINPTQWSWDYNKWSREPKL